MSLQAAESGFSLRHLAQEMLDHLLAVAGSQLGEGRIIHGGVAVCLIGNTRSIIQPMRQVMSSYRLYRTFHRPQIFLHEIINSMSGFQSDSDFRNEETTGRW